MKAFNASRFFSRFFSVPSFAHWLCAFVAVALIFGAPPLRAQSTLQVTAMGTASPLVSVDLQTAGAGDDRGGIAVTPTWVYRVQDGATARLDAATLGLNSVGLPIRDGIFSDLLTGTLWTLWNGSSAPINGTNTSPFSLTAIRQMDANLNILATEVTLSSALSISSGSMIFAGRGFFIIWNSGNSTFYAINTSSGAVTTLGTVAMGGSYQAAENWLAWGVGEYVGGVYSVLYHGAGGNAHRIMRRNASSGFETTAFTFTNLGDMGSLAVSPWHNRWYGHIEFGSEFSATNETIVSATATMNLEQPTITSFTPMNAAPGQTVTINGTFLTGATAVSFGGTPAATFTVVSATQITAVVNAGASGSVSLVTPNGTANLAGFTYNAPPISTLYAARTGGQIGSVSTDGTMQNLAMATGVGFGRDIARMGAYIYWADETGNRIGRANADGSSPNPNFITGCNAPNGVAATATHLYWTNYSSTTIGRANIDGSGVNQSFCNTGVSQPVGIAVDAVGGWLYWSRTNFNSIGRVQLDGSSGLNASFMTGLTNPGGVWIDNAANYIYWTETSANRIQRAQLSTGTGVTTLVTGCNTPVNMTSDGVFLFWSNQATGAIGRALMTGAGATQTFSTGFTGLRGIALGANPAPGVTVTSFTPASAQAGATITVNGTNFAGVTDVLIGGVPVAFTYISPTQITAEVPNVCGSGRITVVTPNGAGVSATDFAYLATYALGQTNFVSGAPGTLNNKFVTPNGLAIDAINNKLYVAEFGNHRVLRFSLPITQNGQLPEVVFGQINFTSGMANGGASVGDAVFNGPFSMSVGSGGNLFIADIVNNRVVMIPAAHLASNAAAATIVLGQPAMTTSAPGVGAQNLASPYAPRIDASGNLWLADYGNRRVLRFTAPISSFQAATLALGVPDFTTNNVVPPSATRAGLTGDVAFVGASVYVSDQSNHRVLRFDPPFVTGMAASGVLGQQSFVAGAANSPNAILGMNAPQSLATNGTDLFVSDVNNHRILVYLNVNAKPNGAAPDAVIAQPNLTTTTSGLSQSKVNDQRDVLLSAAGQLFIADQANHRLLIFGPSFPTPPPVVASFAPMGAVAGATVTITGENFTGATQVQFGGVNAASFTVVSATQITAVVAAGGATGNVTVTTPAGIANLAGFSFHVAPTAFSAASPPIATVGTPYSYIFAANGAPSPTFTVESGTLPPGLSLNAATGELSGAPTGGGGVSAPIVVRATNIAGFVDCAPFTITVHAAPTGFSAETPPLSSLPNAPYPSYTFVANGFPSPTYAVQSGALPMGLSLNAATGELSGTPTVAGIFGPIVIRASNVVGFFDAATFSLQISVAPSVFSAQAPPSGALGLPYSYIFTANGLPAPTYSLQSGTLPPGLTLNATTGELSGTPTATGMFGPAVVRATNIAGSFDTAPFSVTVNIPPSSFTAATPPAGASGVFYSYTFQANGSPAPTYSVAEGTLPPGLSLNAATGELSGMPSAGGSYSGIVIRASNVAGALNSALLTINISGAPTVFNAAPANGVVGTPYSYVFHANGFPLPSYNLHLGVLPPGLTLNGATGELSGTPTMSGVFGVTVIRAANGAGETLSNSFSITISGAPSAPTSFTAQTPPAGTVGAGYSYAFQATGFPSPTYSVQSGALPPGLTLNPTTGVVSGTPSAAGAFGPVVIQASNSAGSLGSAPITFLINGAPTAFSAQTPGAGVVGTGYSYAFQANGLPAPTYSIQSGSLPTGLSLNAATGELSGTPTVAGTFGPIIVQAANAYGSVSSAPASITVAAVGSAPTAFLQQSPPTGAVSSAYSYTFQADGAPAPSYSVQSGALPPGLSLTTSNGLLSGVPTASGLFGPITLQAANAYGSVSSAPFTIAVNAAPTNFSAQTPPAGAVGVAYNYSVVANGYPAPAYSVVAGTLPPGLALSSGGAITGTPTASGVFAGIVVRAQNAFGNANSVPMTISISAGLIAPTSFTAQTPMNANVDALYSYIVQANGSPSPTYSVVAGMLPPGLTLNAATGEISGTPTATGSFGPITIQASNGAGMLNSAPITIVVNPPLPTIESFAPAGAPLGAMVTIAGTNFTGATAVSFGGVAATSFMVVSPTQIDAVVGGGATGNVSVTTPGGVAQKGLFSFFAPPVITDFAPALAAVGSMITINGSGFTGATAVSFGGVPATSFTVVSPTQITAIVPLGALNMPITVVTPAGSTASALGFTLVASSSEFYYQSGPAENPANWNTLPNGGGLTASGFTTSGQSFYVANARTATFAVNTTIGAGVTVQIENGSALVVENGRALNAQGTLRVNNGGRLRLLGSGSVTGVSAVQYIGQNAVLEYRSGMNRLTSNTELPHDFPASLRVDSGSVRLNGSKIINGGLTLSGDGVLRLNGGNGLRLRGNIALEGGRFGADSTNALGIEGAPSGAITGALAFEGASSEAVLGTLQINRANANLALASDVRLTGSLALQAGRISLAAGRRLTLDNAADTALTGGSLGSFVSGAFARRLEPNLAPANPRVWAYPIGKNITYLPALLRNATTGSVAPVVELEAYNAASGGSVGIGLTGALSKTEYWRWQALSGDFVGARAGFARPNLTDSSRVASSLVQSGVYVGVGGELFASPVGQALVSDGVSGASPRFFAVAGPAPVPGDTTPTLVPKITRFAPQRGGAETVVLVEGENLNGVTTMAIGTIPVANFTVLSSTGISVTVGAVKTGPIQIGGPNGGAASNDIFTFVPTPVIQSVSPETAGPGAMVTIRGEHLENVTSLTFGGVTITSFTINPDGSITFIVPQGVMAGATNTQIRLNSEGDMAQATTSVVFVPPPSIASFTPVEGLTGATVRITGANFVGVQSVRFGSDAAFATAMFTRNDSTQITAIVPARVAGMGREVPITVVAAGGVRATSATTFAYSALASAPGGDLANTRIGIEKFLDAVVTNGGEVRVRGSNVQYITDISLRTSVTTGKASFSTQSSEDLTIILPKDMLSGTGGTVSSSATTVVFLGVSNAVAVQNAFVIVAKPEIGSIEPKDAGVGEEIIVRGENLDAITAVSIGGTAATFRVEGSSRLIIRVPAAGASGLPLSGALRFTVFGGASLTPGVTINSSLAGGLPAITSFSPRQGTGGATIIVTGANFQLVNAVSVGGLAVAEFRALSPTQLQIRLAEGASRFAQGLLRLNSPAGETVSRDAFQFTESLEADSVAAARLMSLANANGLLNWRQGVSVGEWRGVEISGNRIIALRAPDAGLSGNLPPEIGSLTELRVIDLSRNALTGAIPASFAALEKLEEFLAANNRLGGVLPSSVVCRWRGLRLLDVSANTLSGEIPECISTLDNAEVLNCSNNQFSGKIPWQLAAMTNLRELRLGGNRLTGELPREFGSIGAERAFAAIAKNAAQMAQAQTLTVIDFSRNQLEGRIPPEWEGIVNMRELYLNDNRLSGELPPGMRAWRSLTVLHLANNFLAGEFPPDATFDNLVSFNVENNALKGALPEGLSQASRLRSARIANNYFTRLPDLSRTRIDTLRAEKNALEFGSLIPIATMVPPVGNFTYAPQRLIGEKLDTTLEQGSTLILPSGIAGADTQYQWFKDSSLARGAQGREATFRVDSVIRVHGGVYFCQATNAALPDLVLQTANASIAVTGADALLGTPQIISPPPGAINVSPNLTLRWSRVEGATDYEVRWRKIQDSRTLEERADTLGQPDAGEPIYVLRGLERGAEYEWSVRSLLRNDRGVTLESGNASPFAYFRVVTAGVDLAFSTVDAGKSAIDDNLDVPGGILINVSSAPLTIVRNGISVVSRDGSFQVKTEQVAGIVQDTTLLPNGELALGIEFTPREAENIVADLQVRYRDAIAQERTVVFPNALRGRGSALVVEPVDFDTVRVGKATVQSIAVTNRSTIHTMQIEAVRILTVRGAPSETAFTFRDFDDLRVATNSTVYIALRCAPMQAGVRRAGVRIDAVSVRDSSITDVAVSSVTAFARMPKPDDAAISLRVRANPETAPPGAPVDLDVIIEEATEEKLRAVALASQPIVRGRIQFNRQVLSLAEGQSGARLVPDPTGSDEANVLFDNTWNGRSASIFTAKVRAVAGRINATTLNLASVEWGTSPAERLPWERKVFVEESVDTSLSTFRTILSRAGGSRFIASTAANAAITAIAPNPAKDQIEVRYVLPESDFITLTLVDARGVETLRALAEVQKAGAHTTAIKVDWIPSGAYILRLATSKGIIVGRVEIVR
jgi:sugar lactone lactonase YvrE